jgi:ADP-ribose pyrophosphatase
MSRKATKTSRKSVSPKPKTPGVRLLSSKEVYRAPVFVVTTNQVKEAGGKSLRRDIIRHSGSVVIMAVDDTAGTKVLLARQYRFAADRFLWELPAGHIDEGEDSLTAGKRELLEETGYAAKHWKRILRFYSSPGFLDETMTVYMATGLTPGQAQPEEDESITKRFFALDRAAAMVRSGKVQDGKTIAAVLWLATFGVYRRRISK